MTRKVYLFDRCNPQDSAMEAREPSTFANPLPAHQHGGFLGIGDGICKALGGLMVWISYCMLADTTEFSDEAYKESAIVEQLNSLLNIRTVVVSRGSGSELEAKIGSIVAQNVQAKIEPVNSFEWAIILRTVGNALDFNAALEAYNSHPDVIAYNSEAVSGVSRGLEEDDETGLSVGDNKLKTIKHWFQDTPDEVLAIIQECQKDLEWKFGPVNERMLRNVWIWMGSVVNLGSSNCISGLQPLLNESTMEIDWTLPITKEGSIMLWTRIIKDYHRSTVIVPMEQKKKYRMKEDTFYNLRNVCVLWSQISDFCKHNFLNKDAFLEFQNDVLTTTRRDGELAEIIILRPGLFSVSMLASQRHDATKAVEAKEKRAVAEMQTERGELREKNFNFMQKSLHLDWETITKIKSSLQIMDDALHRKIVSWQQEQSELGARGITAWCKEHLQQHNIPRYDLAPNIVLSFGRQVSITKKIAERNIYYLILVDYNAPHAANRMAAVIQAVSSTAKQNPTKTLALSILPDVPRDSCARGLCDEERKFDDEMWAAGMFTDCRFIVPHQPADTRADSHNSSRRWLMGRAACDHDTRENNEWVDASEICVAGRPLKKHVVSLPKLKDMVVPESLDADKDVRASDYSRPNVKQGSAQKGIELNAVMLASALQDMQFEEGAALLIVNMTPYLEEVALAFIELRMQAVVKPNLLPVAQDRLRYISFCVGEVKEFNYGVGRCQHSLVSPWQKKLLDTPGFEHDSEPPSLTEEEIDKIPGARAAKGKISSVKWEVCMVSGNKVVIQPDVLRTWTNADDGYAESFKSLQEQHDKEFSSALQAILQPVTGTH